MLNDSEALQQTIEAILMTSGDPWSAKKLHAAIVEKQSSVTANDIKDALAALAEHYQNRGVRLQETAGGFRFQVAENVMPWVHQVRQAKPPRLSPAFLETLAIVAYRQPVTRSDIEAIRGVTVSANILRQMMDRDWIKVVGHKEVPGRPALLATTTRFLDDFGLKKLSDIPKLAELKPLATIEQLHLSVDGDDGMITSNDEEALEAASNE